MAEAGTFAGQLAQTAAQHEVGLDETNSWACSCGDFVSNNLWPPDLAEALAQHRLAALAPLIEQHTQQAVEAAEGELGHLEYAREGLMAECLFQRERATKAEGELADANQQLEAIRELLLKQHPKARDENGAYCNRCGDPWPCKTIKLAGGSE